MSCHDISQISLYISRESTGVTPGNGIPTFVKDGLEQSSLVFFFISDNYKKSEVCLNEHFLNSYSSIRYIICAKIVFSLFIACKWRLVADRKVSKF